MTSEFMTGILKQVESKSDELKHYGVLGMKWGRRRPVGKDGLVKGSPKSDDYNESRKLKPRKQSTLSNSELRRINERLRLERENSQLQSRGAINKIKTGTAIAGTILAVGTTINTAYTFSQTPAGQNIKKMILKMVYDKTKGS